MNRDLILKGVIETEAEQLVIAAVRLATGKKFTRLEVFSKGPEPYPHAAAEKILILAQQRAEGALLQHLTGYQQFFDHEYRVSREVLIPRPETESLALVAIGKIEQVEPDCRLGLEVGVGSGILSIELMNRFPGLTMVATEVSSGAMAVARSNAEKILEPESAKRRFKTLQSDDPEKVMEPFDAFFEKQPVLKADFLISNPPYLLRSEAELEVQNNEPALALFAPEDHPLFFYERIAEQAALYLKEEDGMAFLEIPHERVEEIDHCFRMNSWYTEIFTDLSDRPRVLAASRSKWIK